MYSADGMKIFEYWTWYYTKNQCTSKGSVRKRRLESGECTVEEKLKENKMSGEGMGNRIAWKQESVGAMRRTASSACGAHCLPFRHNTEQANLVLLAGIAIYGQIIALLQCLQESIACSSNKSTAPVDDAHCQSLFSIPSSDERALRGFANRFVRILN